MFVYRFTNTANGKVYIGQTVQPLERRLQIHRASVVRNSQQAVHCAIRKYTWDGFRIETIYQAHSIDELNAMETFFIILHQSFRPQHGYNRTLGGYKRKNAGQVPWNKGKKGAQVAWNKGKDMGEAFRETCRRTHDLDVLARGRQKAWTTPKTPQWTAMMRAQTGSKNPFFGRKHTPETAAKMRDAKLLRLASDPSYKAELVARLNSEKTFDR